MFLFCCTRYDNHIHKGIKYDLRIIFWICSAMTLGIPFSKGKLQQNVFFFVRIGVLIVFSLSRVIAARARKLFVDSQHAVRCDIPFVQIDVLKNHGASRTAIVGS